MGIEPPPGPNPFPAMGLALAIGVFTVAITAGVDSIITGAPLNLSEEFPFFLFQMVIAAFPFLLLALIGIRARTPWLVGLGLTAAFWGYLLSDSISNYGTGRGANIGLGLIMMVSPIIISAICLLVGRRHLSG